jgi:hypothetical protein
MAVQPKVLLGLGWEVVILTDDKAKTLDKHANRSLPLLISLSPVTTY